MSKAVIVFTGKDLNIMQEEGGSGYWVVLNSRVSASTYLLCVRNQREDWSVKDDAEHGQAFLIARGIGCKKSVREGRKVITFKEYAELPMDKVSLKKAWKTLTGGQRYPVAYHDAQTLLDELDIDVDMLDWQSFTPSPVEEIVPESKSVPEESASEVEVKELSEVILEAKRMVADAANLDMSKVSIQIVY